MLSSFNYWLYDRSLGKTLLIWGFFSCVFYILLTAYENRLPLESYFLPCRPVPSHFVSPLSGLRSVLRPSLIPVHRLTKWNGVTGRREEEGIEVELSVTMRGEHTRPDRRGELTASKEILKGKILKINKRRRLQMLLML